MARPIVPSEFSDRDIRRFWIKVRKTDDDDCWKWNGQCRDGYGYLTRGRNGPSYRAHRVAYMLTHGSISHDLDVLHLCGNKTCCRPDHLCLGTPALNAIHRRIHASISPPPQYPDYTPSEAFKLNNRFWAKVDKSEECWLWIGTIHDKQGYGTIRLDKKLVLAHRLAYILTYGQIPDNLYILHSCGTPRCCRPDHLRLGNKRENAADMIAMGRCFRPDNRGERHGLAKLTEHHVLELRELHASGTMNITQLAQKYGVSRATIRLTIRRLRWSHVS